MQADYPQRAMGRQRQQGERQERGSEDTNLALDNIKAQIIKYYQRISDREAYVTAEMVRNAYQGLGGEYETLLGAFDKENEVFKKRVGKDRVRATYMARVRARNHVAAFIKSRYKRNDMSMQELTPTSSRSSLSFFPMKQDYTTVRYGKTACG